MSSDVIEPKQLQIQAVLAEENLIEQLDGFFNRISNIISEIDEMFNDIFQNRLEILRTRIVKTLGMSRDVRNSYRNILEYASRVAPALITGSYYLNMLSNSSELLERINKLCKHLSLLQFPHQQNEDVIISVQKTLNMLVNGIDRLRNVLKAYVEFPVKADGLLAELLKIAQNLRTYYDESYLSLGKSNIDTVSIIVIDDIDGIVDSFIKIYEALSCLHVMKRR